MSPLLVAWVATVVVLVGFAWSTRPRRCTCQVEGADHPAVGKRVEWGADWGVIRRGRVTGCRYAADGTPVLHVADDEHYDHDIILTGDQARWLLRTLERT